MASNIWIPGPVEDTGFGERIKNLYVKLYNIDMLDKQWAYGITGRTPLNRARAADRVSYAKFYYELMEHYQQKLWEERTQIQREMKIVKEEHLRCQVDPTDCGRYDSTIEVAAAEEVLQALCKARDSGTGENSADVHYRVNEFLEDYGKKEDPDDL